MTTGAPPPRLAWRSVLDARRGISRGQVIAVFLFGCAFFLYQSGNNLQLMVQNPNFSQRPVLLAISFVRDQLAAFALLACVVVAEHVTGRMTRQAAYLVAVVVSAAIVGPLSMIPRAATYALRVPGTDTQDRTQDLIAALCDGFFQWLILGGAATFVYVDRRRALAARARMHAAELERTHAAKRTLESQLQAMQARVEPQFLFNTLAQVHGLYRIDAARGERMLDELIAYLRAAMPKMRDTSSTVGQELDLARAYLAIVKVRLGDRLTYEIESPPATSQVRMPPMLLLPLIDHAIARDFSEPGAIASIHIRVVLVGGKVRVEIGDSAVGFLPENEGEGIAGVRERLGTLYEAQASLVLQKRDGRASEVVMEIPYASAPGPMSEDRSRDVL